VQADSRERLVISLSRDLLVRDRLRRPESCLNQFFRTGHLCERKSLTVPFQRETLVDAASGLAPRDFYTVAACQTAVPAYCGFTWRALSFFSLRPQGCVCPICERCPSHVYESARQWARRTRVIERGSDTSRFRHPWLFRRWLKSDEVAQ